MNKKALLKEIKKHPEGDRLLNLGYNPSFVHSLILETEFDDDMKNLKDKVGPGKKRNPKIVTPPPQNKQPDSKTQQKTSPAKEPAADKSVPPTEAKPKKKDTAVELLKTMISNSIVQSAKPKVVILAKEVVELGGLPGKVINILGGTDKLVELTMSYAVQPVVGLLLQFVMSDKVSNNADKYLEIIVGKKELNGLLAQIKNKPNNAKGIIQKHIDQNKDQIATNIFKAAMQGEFGTKVQEKTNFLFNMTLADIVPDNLEDKIPEFGGIKDTLLEVKIGEMLSDLLLGDKATDQIMGGDDAPEEAGAETSPVIQGLKDKIDAASGPEDLRRTAETFSPEQKDELEDYILTKMATFKNDREKLDDPSEINNSNALNLNVDDFAGMSGAEESDKDEDGLPDKKEDELGTDSTNPDTDKDGATDGSEVENETDPTDADDTPDEKDFKLSDEFVSQTKEFTSGFYEHPYLYLQGKDLKNMIQALRKEAAQEKTAALGRTGDFEKMQEQVYNIVSKMVIIENEAKEEEGLDFNNIKNSFKMIVASAVRIKKSLKKYIGLAKEGAVGAKNAREVLYKLLAELMQLCNQFVETLQKAQTSTLKEAEGDEEASPTEDTAETEAKPEETTEEEPEGDKIEAGEDTAGGITDGQRVHNFYDFIAELATQEGQYSSAEDNGMQAFKAEVQEQINNVIPALKRFPSVAPFNNPNLDNIGKDINEYMTDYDNLIKNYLKQSLLYFKQTSANKGTTGEAFTEAISNFGQFIAGVGSLFNINTDGKTGDGEAAGKIEKGIEDIPQTNQVTEGDILSGLGLTLTDEGNIDFASEIEQIQKARKDVEELFRRFPVVNGEPEQVRKLVYEFAIKSVAGWYKFWNKEWFLKLYDDLSGEKKLKEARIKGAGSAFENPLDPSNKASDYDVIFTFMAEFVKKLHNFIKGFKGGEFDRRDALNFAKETVGMIEDSRGKATFADFVSRIQSASLDAYNYASSVEQIIPKQKVEKIIAKMQTKIDSLTPESFLTILSKLSNNGKNYNIIYPYLDSFTNISIDVFKNNPRYIKLYVGEDKKKWSVEPKEELNEEFYPKIASITGSSSEIQKIRVNVFVDRITSRGLKDLGISDEQLEPLDNFSSPKQLIEMFVKKEEIPEDKQPEELFGKEDVTNSILLPVYEELVKYIEKEYSDVKKYEGKYNLDSLKEMFKEGRFSPNLIPDGLQIGYYLDNKVVKIIKMDVGLDDESKKLALFYDYETDAGEPKSGGKFFEQAFSSNLFVNAENPKTFFRVNNKEEFIKLLSVMKIDPTKKINEWAGTGADDFNNMMKRILDISKINFAASRIEKIEVTPGNILIDTKNESDIKIPITRTFMKVIENLSFTEGVDMISLNNKLLQGIFKDIDRTLNNEFSIDELRESFSEEAFRDQFEQQLIRQKEALYYHNAKWYKIDNIQNLFSRARVTIKLAPIEDAGPNKLIGAEPQTIENIRYVDFFNQDDSIMRAKEEIDFDKISRDSQFFNVANTEQLIAKLPELEVGANIFDGNYENVLDGVSPRLQKIISKFLQHSGAKIIKEDDSQITNFKVIDGFSLLNICTKIKQEFEDTPYRGLFRSMEIFKFKRLKLIIEATINSKTHYFIPNTLFVEMEKNRDNLYSQLEALYEKKFDKKTEADEPLSVQRKNKYLNDLAKATQIDIKTNNIKVIEMDDQVKSLKDLLEKLLSGGFDTISQKMNPKLFSASNVPKWPPEIGAKYKVKETFRSAGELLQKDRVYEVTKSDSLGSDEYEIEMKDDANKEINYTKDKKGFERDFEFQKPEGIEEQIQRKLEVIIERFINQRKQQWRKRTM